MCKSLLVFFGFSILVFSCSRDTGTATIRYEEKFTLNYGSFENQLNLFNLNTTGSIDTSIAMRDGFFYIANGQSQKIIELNSFGDLLTLYHNEDTNPPPLFDGHPLDEASAYSTRKTVQYPLNSPSLLALDSSKYIYTVETLPRDRHETDDNKILRQVVLRFNSEAFVDYIGQQGIGGTPFPYIKKIYTTSDDCLVVVCVTNEGFEVFYYDARGNLLHNALVRYADQPKHGEEKSGVTRYGQIENVAPDPMSRRLYVKADYYETHTDPNKAANGVGEVVTVIFPYDLNTGQFGTGIEIPPYEEPVTNGISKQTYRLPYDFIGAAAGWLFFMLPLDTGCAVQMVRSDGSRIVQRYLNFDTKNIVFSSFSLSDTGIISALLADRDKAHVVWWRTDDLARAILEQ